MKTAVVMLVVSVSTTTCGRQGPRDIVRVGTFSDMQSCEAARAFYKSQNEAFGIYSCIGGVLER